MAAFHPKYRKYESKYEKVLEDAEVKNRFSKKHSDFCMIMDAKKKYYYYWNRRFI